MLMPYKRKLKISELSNLLKIKKSTIKLWERELQLSTESSHLYSEEEIALFQKIKVLVHEKSYSLKEVREELNLIPENADKLNDSFTPAHSTCDETDEESLFESTQSHSSPNIVSLHQSNLTDQKIPNTSIESHEQDTHLRAIIQTIKTITLDIKRKLE